MIQHCDLRFKVSLICTSIHPFTHPSSYCAPNCQIPILSTGRQQTRRHSHISKSFDSNFRLKATSNPIYHKNAVLYLFVFNHVIQLAIIALKFSVNYYLEKQICQEKMTFVQNYIQLFLRILTTTQENIHSGNTFSLFQNYQDERGNKHMKNVSVINLTHGHSDITLTQTAKQGGI